jgi:hypothetical protein
MHAYRTAAVAIMVNPELTLLSWYCAISKRKLELYRLVSRIRQPLRTAVEQFSHIKSLFIISLNYCLTSPLTKIATVQGRAKQPSMQSVRLSYLQGPQF